MRFIFFSLPFPLVFSPARLTGHVSRTHTWRLEARFHFQYEPADAFPHLTLSGLDTRGAGEPARLRGLRGREPGRRR